MRRASYRISRANAKGVPHLLRFLDFFGGFDIPKGDRRTVAHAAEDTAGCVEEVRRGVELGDLAHVEDTYPVVANDRA